MEMALSDVIHLVAVSVSKDRYGVNLESETLRQVFCKVKSVSQSEFFGGGRNGLKPELKFEVFAGDYRDEPIVLYRGSRYAVYRSYLVPGTDRLELYTERKGGTNGPKDSGGQAVI